MARTTGELVGGIIEVDDTIDLEPFITMANELVTEVCAPVLRSDGVTAWYNATRLELIERSLAAHFYACMMDLQLTSGGAGGAQASYMHKNDLGLDLTHHGQMAKRLDTYGGLAALDNMMKKGRQTVRMNWGGLQSEDWPNE